MKHHHPKHPEHHPRGDEQLPELPLHDLFHVITLGGCVMAGVGAGLALLLHITNRRGTFAFLLAPIGLIVVAAGQPIIGWGIVAGCALGCCVRERLRYDEIKKGGDKARKQRDSVGLLTTLRNWHARRRYAGEPAVVKGRYPLGLDKRRGLVWLPLGLDGGKHTLVVGATGSGKTNTVMSTINANLVAGCGVVVIDPKGDHELAARMRRVAFNLDRPFWHFSLDGQSDRWNPLANGTPTELADKLIGAEEWTEPHYKRFYQRYLLAVFVAIRARGDEPDLAKVVDLLYPERFALYLRSIEEDKAVVDGIAQRLASLTPQETGDLASLRNRLALLVEGDYADLLSSEGDPARQIDLLLAITQGAVVVFSLNSNSSPETAALLGAAIFQDLKHVTGLLESNPHLRHPAAVVVDEFGAFGADHVLGLFQRARSARLSLTLITQELAGLQSVTPAFRDQVVGNVETIIAHRQNVPESAELVAELGGTREVWIHTFQTEDSWSAPAGDHSGLGTKRRGREFHVAPDTIKALDTGQAVVITKNPHTVRVVDVYLQDAYQGVYTPEPTIEIQNRVAAYAEARPDRLHAWYHRN